MTSGQTASRTHEGAETPAPRGARLCYALAVAAGLLALLSVTTGLGASVPGAPMSLLVAAGVLWAVAALFEWRARRRTTSAPSTSAEDEEAGEETASGEDHLSTADRMILEALERRKSKDAAMKRESEIFEVLDPEPLEKTLGGDGAIELTFEDLQGAPPLLAQSIQLQMDRIPAREPETIARRRQQDTYHVRDDGARYDLRHLRAV